jgi:hypothetical protein
MKHLVIASAMAVVLFGASAAWAQQPEMGQPVALRDVYGRPLGTSSNPVVVSGASSGGSTTTTPTSSTYTASSTANTPTQVAATDATRKDLAIVYPATATGVLTIYENAGTAASYYLQPGQTYRAAANGLVYTGAIYAASTVASDTAAVTVYR